MVVVYLVSFVVLFLLVVVSVFLIWKCRFGCVGDFCNIINSVDV